MLISFRGDKFSEPEMIPLRMLVSMVPAQHVPFAGLFIARVEQLRTTSCFEFTPQSGSADEQGGGAQACQSELQRRRDRIFSGLLKYSQPFPAFVSALRPCLGTWGLYLRNRRLIVIYPRGNRCETLLRGLSRRERRDVDVFYRASTWQREVEARVMAKQPTQVYFGWVERFCGRAGVSSPLPASGAPVGTAAPGPPGITWN